MARVRLNETAHVEESHRWLFEPRGNARMVRRLVVNAVDEKIDVGQLHVATTYFRISSFRIVSSSSSSPTSCDACVKSTPGRRPSENVGSL